MSLGEEAHEREVEKALVRHMENFILELGAGFSFVGRQYHLEVAGHDNLPISEIAKQRQNSAERLKICYNKLEITLDFGELLSIMIQTTIDWIHSLKKIVLILMQKSFLDDSNWLKQTYKKQTRATLVTEVVRLADYVSGQKILA